LERLQDEHVEGALQQLDSIAIDFPFGFHGCRESTSMAVDCLLAALRGA
jgi:hypothetical protein